MIRKSLVAFCLIAACSIPALAGITVNSPSSGAEVAPEFTLSAVATTCSNQPVTAMGFSLDSSSNTTIVNSTSIDATVTATTGAHTLHVKAWGQGVSCVTDVAITVTATAGTSNGVSVTTPGNNATVSSPFTVSADALTCSSQPVSTMGYSLDSGGTTVFTSTSINTSVSASAGAHTLHVKAWGNSGAVCVSNVAITVSSSSTATSATAEGITVTSPGNGATVPSPFTLDASATDCSSQPVSAMGYSLDTSSNTATVNGTSVAASITASAGAHTLHVKSWGSGTSCVANIAINVSGSGSTTTTASGVTISAPANGASVSSPFQLSASASTCSSQTVSSIGYGLDNATKTISTGGSIDTEVSASAGSHTVHITAWGSSGAICNANVVVDVTDAASPINSVVPSDATSVSSIQALSNWVATNDPGTASGSSGTSSGTMAMVGSPSLSGNARRFNTSFTNSAGEVYHVSFSDDTSATNFLYDGWVYLTSSASNIANLEMDLNQVTSNGQTMIFGFQCDGYSGTWDYTKNGGTPTQPSDQWVHSSAACNPQNWAVNTWHHIQVSYSRDDAGHVTYHSVWLDGAESAINATVSSSFALGWSPVLLTNFQVDGRGTGSNTVYLDNLTIYRW